MPKQQTQSTNLNSGKTPSELFNSDLFGKLFEADKNRLYCYIYAYVSDAAAADDIFQETCLTLWKEFSKFEEGTSFSKWANSIAFNRVRVFRRNQNKYELGLTDDFLLEFSDNISIIENSFESREYRWRYLEQCIGKMSSSFKPIYKSFYIQNLMAHQIAEDTGRSIYAIRKVIHKIRKTLFDCVEKKLKKDAS